MAGSNILFAIESMQLLLKVIKLTHLLSTTENIDIFTEI